MGRSRPAVLAVGGEAACALAPGRTGTSAGRRRRRDATRGSVVGLEQLLAPLLEAADLGELQALAQLLHQLLRAIRLIATGRRAISGGLLFSSLLE